MSWEKLIPLAKYLGMWTVFAAVGVVLMLAGFGVAVGEWAFLVKEGLEVWAIAAGFVCMVIGTWLFKVKLEKMSK